MLKCQTRVFREWGQKQRKELPKRYCKSYLIEKNPTFFFFLLNQLEINELGGCLFLKN